MSEFKYIKLSNELFDYLNRKKVPMLQDISNNLFFPIRITRTGLFFKGNGKVIRKEIALELFNKSKQ